MTKRTNSQLCLLGGLLILMILCNVIVGGKLLSVNNLLTILSHAVFPVLAS